MSRLLGGVPVWVLLLDCTAERPGPQRRERDLLDATFRTVFVESDEAYGASQVHAQLACEGTAGNVKFVAKSMLRRGLESICTEKFSPVTTLPGVDVHVIPDPVKLSWDQGELDRRWTYDISYLRAGEGWVIDTQARLSSTSLC